MTILRRTLLLLSVSTLSLSVPLAAQAQSAPGGSEGFSGKIGLTRARSVAAFPKQAEAPKSAPNVVVILLDDVGFAATSTFGGLARTPNLDALAADGVRYNRFNTTAICSPTRAALLTGRNQHQVGFGNLQDIAAGFPAYNTIWKKETASVARILHDNGYSTAAFGKWHNTPQWEISSAGPFTHWPTGLGFDHFYGFLNGEDNQWEPHLYDNTTPVESPNKASPGYHLTVDLVDHAVRWVDEHDALAGAKPYFLYFATGAVHQPHHVPAEWIARNKGRFDGGWDRYREEAFVRQKRLGVIPANTQLTPRPDGLPAWDSLTPDQKKLYARQMEVYSAFLEHTDHEVGRLIHEIRSRPGGENTLIFYIVGDNGGSAEGGLDGSLANEAASGTGGQVGAASQLAQLDKFGGPEVANHYAAGWGWATTAPFQWMKQVASHFGGTRNPLIVSWPGHTNADGAVRGQFGHVNDIAPTILDAAGIAFPDTIDGVKQIPFEGRSLVPTFTNPAAPEAHREQYFEIFGNRAIYRDGWVAAARRPYLPWKLIESGLSVYTSDPETDRWELYHVDQDFSEANDLAAKEPARLAELKAEFEKEGVRNGVFPLLPAPIGAPTIFDPAAKRFVFKSDIGQLPRNALPDLSGRAHRFEVDIRGDAATGSGVLLAEGGQLGGFALYVRQGRLVFENNAYGQDRQTVVSSDALPSGATTVAYEYVPDHPAKGALLNPTVPGTVTLFVNGRQVASGPIGKFSSAAGAYSEGFDIGLDRGSQASADAAGRARYSQPLGEVRLLLK
ncbi:arylsulfatase [Sphingomonas sp. QA11]|uniref:arylsulfatase n=1 Tax=Sphingomonas sp. QA11 TaxID=2950605 RepID=UPI00234B1EA1|nr:arylsulfatase [Sphingomonas sp. QA11]WCM25071.1 arylsulfatase [Sphingomonas sp. QA11]